MQTVVSRFQQVFGTFTTICFVIAGLVAFTDFFSTRNPSASISVNNVQTVRGRPHYASSRVEEYANIRFSADIDLRSLFTWNTKTVFVYVSANFPTNSSSLSVGNEAVIWDAIITTPSSDHLSNLGPAALKKLRRSSEGKSIDPSRGLLKLKNQKPKYQITTPKGKVAEIENVTLQVHYNVQPWVGLLTWSPGWEIGKWKKIKGGVSKPFKLPPLKKKEEAKEKERGTAKAA